MTDAITKAEAEDMARAWWKMQRAALAAIRLPGHGRGGQRRGADGKIYNTARFEVAGFVFRFTDGGEPIEVSQ